VKGDNAWEVMDNVGIKKKVSQALRENLAELRNMLSQQSIVDNNARFPSFPSHFATITST